MLDDLKMIHERDAEDALGIAEKQWEQLAYEYQVSIPTPSEPIQNIVFGGMGGSALSAAIAQSWPGFNVPFEICRNYDIPAYVNENTLFIASSYSGNTEETLTALEAAEAKGARIAVMTGGGKLSEIAQEKGYLLLLLPKVSQPRFAAFYSLKALLTISDGVGATNGASAILASKADYIKQATAGWVATVPTDNNQAKQLAQEVIGKSVVVYGGHLMAPAAYKWKISFNENAKQVAWYGVLPEFNHNEFIGWTKQPVEKPYTVIDLLSSFENQRTQLRFEITERLLSGVRPSSIAVNAEGSDAIEHLLWTITLGDFVSLYTALLNGLNPTPVDLVEKLKVELVK